MNLLHLFIPHYKNNFRAKILHHSSLLILIFAFTALSALGIAVRKSHPEVLGIAYQISNQELLNLVNFERTKQGLNELQFDSQLSSAASNKASHMFQNNYWAHFAPDGTTPWVFIKNQGYAYTYAGENLAKGFTTSYDAVKAWMNSPTHRDNILSEKYLDVGFAIKEGRIEGEDTILIVQMLGARSSLALNAPRAVSQTETILTQNEVEKGQTLGTVKKVTSEVKADPLFDLVFGTKAVVFSILSILLTALLIDFIIVEKNKIPRIVGNNLDHIILLLLFTIFMFMSKLGNIL